MQNQSSRHTFLKTGSVALVLAALSYMKELGLGNDRHELVTL